MRADFRQACAERSLGEVLRLAKRWGGVGFTASHLARRCELTVSRVQDYINGRVQAQRVEIFERVADGLHIPGEMFDLAPRSWETRSGHVRPVADASHSQVPSEDGDPSVLRRDFMKLGAGLAATSMVAQLPGMPSRVAGNRVGASTVDELRARFGRLRLLDDHLGGADTYGYYLAEVEKTAGLLKDGSFASGPARREMLSFFAEQAQQAGWAAFDAGWHDKAKDLYERSFNAAKEADDAALAANALALRSYQLLPSTDVAVDLTDKSCAIAAKSAHPGVKSLLYQRGAWTYAVAGQADKAAWALGEAEHALTASPSDGFGPEWALWAHNPTELQIITGRCWTELHRPLRAVPALEAAMAQYDDSHARDKALYLSWLAEAYLDAGEVEHSATAVSRALDLSANVASARPQQRLSVVVGRLEPHQSVPEVADLLAQRPLDPFQVGS
ncbi:helix-turn-helix domain-containing protein [Amycolatopsis methanolica]|uniref:helix-turn-helix domain-containing protein n=1 Tax=Amycolatopsis methanolica TaxID=1814 RepID=UPI0034439111